MSVAQSESLPKLSSLSKSFGCRGDIVDGERENYRGRLRAFDMLHGDPDSLQRFFFFIYFWSRKCLRDSLAKGSSTLVDFLHPFNFLMKFRGKDGALSNKPYTVVNISSGRRGSRFSIDAQENI